MGKCWQIFQSSWSIWCFPQSWTSTKTRNTKAVSQVDPDSSLLGSAGGKLKKNMEKKHGLPTSNGWFLRTNSRLMVTRPMNPMGIGNYFWYPLFIWDDFDIPELQWRNWYVFWRVVRVSIWKLPRSILVGGFNPPEKYYIVKLDHFPR